jgi:hypothetical protein
MVRTPQTVLIRCEAIAGILGLLLLWRTDNRAKWIITGVWLGYPLIYYFVEAFARYRYPIDWSFVLLGAFLAAKGAQTNQLHQRDPLGADRPAAAETTSRLRPTPQNKFPTPLANCFIFRLSAVKPSSSNAIENYRFPECQNSSAHCEGHFS